MAHEHARTEQSITDAIYAWNAGKAQFKRQQIAIAVDRLRSGGWLADNV